MFTSRKKHIKKKNLQPNCIQETTGLFEKCTNQNHFCFEYVNVLFSNRRTFNGPSNYSPPLLASIFMDTLKN